MSDLLTRLDSAYKSSLEVGDLWNLTEEAAERIRELEGRFKESQNDIARLNQMLRATGYGQGQIDAYVAQCEDIDALQALVRKLESAVKLALDLSENGLIDYKEHGLTCHDDIEQKYRNALEPPR